MNRAAVTVCASVLLWSTSAWAEPEPSAAPALAEPAAPAQATAPVRSSPLLTTTGSYVPPSTTDAPVSAKSDARRVRTRAILGFVGAGLTTVLGFASAATDDDTQLALGAGTTASILTFGALAGTGHGTILQFPNVEGSRSLRIVGWVTYGAALANALAIGGVALGDNDPPVGGIVSATVLGVVALTSLGVDSMLIANEASDIGLARATAPTLMPYAEISRTAGLLGARLTF